MPRKPRLFVPGFPHHVIQRGNNRSACFFSNEDYQVYLDFLGDACERYGVALHAYVLMTNHSHLLMSPENADGISRVMQSLGRRYVQYINKKYIRSGTLWEGRHKSSLVDADSYLLACYRYIELNPVRAGMVDHPGDYPWSSYRVNACGASNSILTSHPVYQGLGSEPVKRQLKYQELVSSALNTQVLDSIRTAATFSMPLGSARFQKEIEQMLDRKLGYAKRGRPVRIPMSNEKVN